MAKRIETYGSVSAVFLCAHDVDDRSCYAENSWSSFGRLDKGECGHGVLTILSGMKDARTKSERYSLYAYFDLPLSVASPQKSGISFAAVTSLKHTESLGNTNEAKSIRHRSLVYRTSI